MAYHPAKMSLEEIAKKIDVSARTLRRWRESPEWLEEWNKRDLAEVDASLRMHVMERGDAALYNTFYKRHGGFADEDVLAQALKMTDTEAIRIATDAAAWLQDQNKS